MFWSPKWRHGRPRFDVSFDFWRFAAMLKNHNFWTPSRWTTKSKKSTLGAPKVRKKCPPRRRGCHFWPGGSRGPPRARGLVKKKTTEEQTSSWCEIWHAMGRWPGEFPTTLMLRVSFSPGSECVDADYWSPFFGPPRGSRNTVIAVLWLFFS